MDKEMVQFDTGQIKRTVDSRWYPFTMRLLGEADLSPVLNLYDFVCRELSDVDTLWRYPDEMVALFLTDKAIAVGVFVDETLVGFRVFYYHAEDDADNPLRAIGFPHQQTAHAALSFVHPEFRGNALQQHMSRELLRIAKECKPFQNLCSIVSPKNAASIKEKFSLGMVAAALMLKFSGTWRYIFYKDAGKTWVVSSDSRPVFVPVTDYSRQIELINQGCYGYQLEKRESGTGVLFGKGEWL